MVHAHRYLLAIVFVSALCAAGVLLHVRSDRVLRVYFLDVGQGDAVYVRAPGGSDMLVDAGPGPAVLREMSRAMPFYDRFIDVAVATHPDADHIGGFPPLLSRYGVGVMLEPGVSSDNAIDDELARRRKSSGIDSILARRGMSIDLGGGAVFEILFPAGDVAFLETNTASIIGRIVYGSTSVMLTGDSPRSVESALVREYGASLRSDVLKAGHHGSHTSSGEGFVRAVSPRYAVISAGEGNRYGHPHREVVGLFDRLGISTLGTYESGTIACASDGVTISCE